MTLKEKIVARPLLLKYEHCVLIGSNYAFFRIVNNTNVIYTERIFETRPSFNLIYFTTIRYFCNFLYTSWPRNIFRKVSEQCRVLFHTFYVNLLFWNSAGQLGGTRMKFRNTFAMKFKYLPRYENKTSVFSVTNS